MNSFYLITAPLLIYLLTIPIIGGILVMWENRKVTAQEEEQNPYIVPERVIQRIKESRGFLIWYFSPFILLSYLLRKLLGE